MNVALKTAAIGLSLLVSLGASATELDHWPAEAATQLDRMITANAHKGNYAVFDMDNTSYRYDLEEALLPFMENKGLLSRDKLDPSLKLIPFKDSAEHKESLFSYLLPTVRDRRHGLLPLGGASVFRLHPQGTESTGG